jgi:hypothetical protein
MERPTSEVFGRDLSALRNFKRIKIPLDSGVKYTTISVGENPSLLGTQSARASLIVLSAGNPLCNTPIDHGKGE